MSARVGDDPTGLVFNSTPGFAIKGGKQPGAVSVRQRDRRDQRLERVARTTAEPEVDLSAENAVFKGLAIA
jgi:hypothetical protein